jgi:hypothetical protein
MDDIEDISNAQQFVRRFAIQRNWVDKPNVDKFDHLHEELSEIAAHFVGKTEQTRVAVIQRRHASLESEVGYFYFGFCQLATLIDVDVQTTFNTAKTRISTKYQDSGSEGNIVTRE